VGEDNTKFFHGLATQRFRRNLISGLKAKDGSIVSNHQQMAAIILTKYKERMGQARGIQEGLDLNTLIMPIDGLD
jgi:hypothetical protein